MTNSTGNLVEVQESELSDDVLDALGFAGTMMTAAVDTLTTSNLSPSDALRAAGRAAGVIGSAATFYDVYVESGDPLRATAAVTGGIAGGVAATIVVVAIVGTGGIPVLLTFAVFTVASAVGSSEGEKVFLAAYDGAQWAYREATTPLPIDQLIAESGLLPVELEGRLYGSNLGDDISLEQLVRTENGLLIAQQESSYFNHNSTLWEGALSQSGLSVEAQQSIDIDQVERVKDQYIAFLRANGKTVNMGSVAEIYAQIAVALAEKRALIGTLNGGALRLTNDALAALIDPAAIAFLDDANSSALLPDIDEATRFSGESTLFNQVLADNAVLKFDEASGAFRTIARIVVVDPSTGQEVAVWVSDTGVSVNGLATITQAELDHFAQTGTFPGGDRYKAMVADHGEVGLDQLAQQVSDGIGFVEAEVTRQQALDPARTRETILSEIDLIGHSLGGTVVSLVYAAYEGALLKSELGDAIGGAHVIAPPSGGGALNVFGLFGDLLGPDVDGIRVYATGNDFAGLLGGRDAYIVGDLSSDALVAHAARSYSVLI